MTTSASSVIFSPYNYHIRDRSRAMTNGVKIDVSKEGKPEVQFYGTGEERKDVQDALLDFKGQPAPVKKYYGAAYRY